MLITNMMLYLRTESPSATSSYSP